MTAPFGDRLAAAVARTGSALCVGIDPRAPFPDDVLRGLSGSRSGHARAVERYSEGLIEAVAPYCCAIKPQIALFELYGGYGLTALDAVCATAREHGLLVLADAKRGDIASTATAYAEAWIGIRPGEDDPLADAVTVNAYMGPDTVEPFLDVADRHGAGLFVLARTSNPGARELEERELADGGQVWERVAGWIDDWSAGRTGESGLSAVGAVIGATAPEVVRLARDRMPATPLLLPGVGAQGGRIEDLAPAFERHPAGGLVVAARSVIEAWRETDGDWRSAVATAAQAHQRAIAALHG
ncbi:MAG: orotidine-5'-phosphate decarboxylase [Gaiellales bacterium]